MATQNIFNGTQYKLIKKAIQLFGQSFKIQDADGKVILYSKLKAFKLKEDIRVYSDQECKNEVLEIHARAILDFAANYDVTDSATGKVIGTLQRKGLKSLIIDEWIIKDNNDQEIGKIKEDKMLLALIRRFITPLIPQAYVATIGDTEVAEFKQNFNPFVYKLDINISDTTRKLDPRMAICAAILLGAIEGKQR